MITAVFTDNDDYAHAYGLWQWDYGQQLRIEGLHLPTAVEIHFALQETGGEAITRVGTPKDGVTTVPITDSMLEGNSTVWTADKAYNIYAWVYLSDKSSGETIKRITMQVKSRPKPEAFEAPGDGEIFHEAIEAVNDAAKRAEEAGDKAIAAADEAEKAATQTAEHLQATEGLAEQVETNADTVAQDKQAVAGMLSQVQQAASDAALSAQAAKLSETAAAQAQTGAEAAEDGARQYAEETGADRQAVANDKQAVGEMREAVAEDRQAVEQTTTQFGQTAQDALTAIGQAQSTAVGAIKAEGNKQATAVQEAGTQAVSEVTEAKTEAVQSVTAEGDKQTKRVEDAAAGIVADREQINQNKTDIAGLVEGMTDLAPAIHSTASGSVITANDAAEGRPFRGLRVFGKSMQVQTTGAQLLRDDLYKTVTTKGITIELKNCVVSFKGTFTDDGTGERPVLDVWINKDEFIGKTLKLVSDHPESYMVFRVTNINGESKYDVVEATIDETVKEVVARFFYRKTKPSSGTVINETQKVMLCESKNKEKPWEPYTGGKPSPSPEYPQEIASAGESGNITVEVRGKNLLQLQDGRGGNRGVEVTCRNGEISLVGTATETGWAILKVNPPVVLNGDYALSTSNDVECYLINNNYKIAIATPKPQNIVNGEVVKIAFGVTEGKIYNMNGIKVMLNRGLTASPYEPPRIPQSLTLQTPNGLPGIPVSKDGNYTDADGQQWICDEIDLGRGKYVQRVKDFIINRNTNISTSMGDYGAPEKDTILARYLDKTIKKLGAVLCRELICAKNWSNDSESVFATETSIDFRLSRKRLGLETETTTDENKTAVLKFLETTPLHGLVELNTPIERDLTPEEIAAYKALRTYGPTTVVSSDAGAEMEATYVADTGKYIQNLEERLNAKMVNIQSALISQKTSGGGHLTIADSSPLPVEEFSMTGKTEQMKTTGKNLLKPNDHNVYHELPLKAGTVVTLMTNGQLSEGGNIKFIGMENENVWFAIDKGQTRVCHSIGNKDVKGFYNLLTKKEGLEYMLAIGDVKIFEPYSGGFSSPSPDWEQPIEITDQPVTITVKGGTEQQSIILTPPRPFTKWDKLEKVNGVWCWVYQHKVLSGTEMAKNLSGIHTSGALMVNVSGLGIAESQDNSVCNKLICPTKSVASLAYGEFRILYGTIYLKIDGVTTVEDGRQWLESNDIIIIAQASAPEYIPLAASEQAQLNALTMYAGTTEITNNGGCTMDLTYTVDTKTYIDSKLAAISAAMIGGT